MQTIKYAMTKDYRAEWGIVDAVRELVQNCIDNDVDQSSYVIGNGLVTITTHNYIAPMSVFALGESQNKDENSIGGFGEGFKIALLVLEREQCNPVMNFGASQARPQFIHDDLLHKEVMSIEVSEADTVFNGTKFSFNVPESLVSEIKKKVTVFSDKPLQSRLDDIEVLSERPGDIFVNGLFVCNVPQFLHGYNFPAHMVSLGCDRQIANPLGMAWETSKYWANNATAHTLLQMMTDTELDVQDLYWHVSESVAKEITEAFIERYGAVTIKPMGSMLSYGMGVGTNLYNTLRKSGNIKVANSYEEEGTPYTLIKEFLSNNKKHMLWCAKKNLQELLQNARSWSK